MNILVSACLLGVNCRWDGGTNGPHPDVAALMKKHNLIPICPEIMGGLPTPRQPSERRGSFPCSGLRRSPAGRRDYGASSGNRKLFTSDSPRTVTP